jgi:hypothetical protein
MTTELVKINASDYGLEESKAAEIKAMFLPMLNKMDELEAHYNDILKQEINPETCQMAKDLRLVYVKTRTGTAEIHKKLKAFYLAGGRFVDAFKNIQEAASGEKEKTLKAIEDHFENMERERTEKLRIARLEMLKPYTEIEPLSLGRMEQAVFDNLLAGFKLAYETQKAAEKKAEEDRIAQAKAEAEAREAQRLENIRLKEEAIEKERLAEIERKKKAKLLADQKAKADKERADLMAKNEEERKEKERLAAEIESKNQAEAKAKRDAEIKAEAEKKAKLAEEKKAKLAPDKDKLLNFMQAINDLPRPDVKSVKAANIAANANGLLIKVANYIKENADKL